MERTSCIKACRYCGDAWLYASTGDYGSGYEAHGYKIECLCGYAWKHYSWHTTAQEAICEWNTAEVGTA